MNKAQANRTAKLNDKLIATLEQLEAVQETATNAFENRSERWQESEQGEQAQENLQALEQGIAYLSDAIDTLQSIVTE